MKETIDLYLVSGFLGAGKTTFLQHILSGKDTKRVGVIVNEYGVVGIDGKVLEDEDASIMEINSGSIFCACLKGDFVKTLADFLEKPIDRLYVEASGMADPSSMSELLSQLNFLLEKQQRTRRQYHYCGSVCLVDAGHFIDLSMSLVAPVNQIKKSNFILLNKIDTVSEEGRKKVHKRILEIRPDAVIYDTTFAKVDTKIFDTYLTGEINASREAVSSNTPWNRPFEGVLSLPDTYDLSKMKEFLKRITRKMVRVKGFFSTAEGFYYVSCVGEDIEITKSRPEERKEKSLVVIAREEEELTPWIQKEWETVFSCACIFRRE